MPSVVLSGAAAALVVSAAGITARIAAVVVIVCVVCWIDHLTTGAAGTCRKRTCEQSMDSLQNVVWWLLQGQAYGDGRQAFAAQS